MANHLMKPALSIIGFSRFCRNSSLSPPGSALTSTIQIFFRTIGRAGSTDSGLLEFYYILFILGLTTLCVA